VTEQDPWEPAQPVDAARAAALVGEQFPELRDAAVRPLAHGWDNTVVLVGDVLFRFPRRESAVVLQARELAVLPRVAGRVPLAVPEPTHLGSPAGDYPWPFWGAAMIPGAELAGTPDDVREPAAAAAGAFLRALHALPADDLGLPVDPNGRATPSLRAERSREALDTLRRRGLWSGSAEVDALVDSRLGPPVDRVLVHGDLHLRHLLVDTEHGATGVIDWGDTCLASPAVDLSLAWAAFRGRSRTAMLGAYGPVDADTELRGRALAVSLCAMLAVWASSTGADDLLAEYLRGLERAVED
jgi:aminoglycoside phosphotransferase (APT) family kinase protein